MKLPEVLGEVVRVVGVADHWREQVDDQVQQVEVDGFQFERGCLRVQLGLLLAGLEFHHCGGGARLRFPSGFWSGRAVGRQNGAGCRRNGLVRSVDYIGLCVVCAEVGARTCRPPRAARLHPCLRGAVVHEDLVLTRG